MKHKVYILLRNSVTTLLLIAMLGLILNKVLFTHVHITENGAIISHAHPYSKTTDNQPFKTHHHTHNDYSVIDHLYILYFLLASGMLALIFRYRQIKHGESICFYASEYAKGKPSRAPPYIVPI